MLSNCNYLAMCYYSTKTVIINNSCASGATVHGGLNFWSRPDFLQQSVKSISKWGAFLVEYVYGKIQNSHSHGKPTCNPLRGFPIRGKHGIVQRRHAWAYGLPIWRTLGQSFRCGGNYQMRQFDSPQHYTFFLPDEVREITVICDSLDEAIAYLPRHLNYELCRVNGDSRF